jgi:hypothetical protein
VQFVDLVRLGDGILCGCIDAASHGRRRGPLLCFSGGRRRDLGRHIPPISVRLVPAKTGDGAVLPSFLRPAELARGGSMGASSCLPRTSGATTTHSKDELMRLFAAGRKVWGDLPHLSTSYATRSLLILLSYQSS